MSEMSDALSRGSSSTKGVSNMTTSFRESAKIYQFPARTRPALGGYQEAKPGENPSAPASPRVTEAAFGGAWYHEAAVQEADRPSRS
jgi:hypothetical protein